MLEIFSRIKLRPKQLIAVIVFVLISCVAQMMIPTLVSTMINDGGSNSNTSLLITLAPIMIGLTVLACVMSILGARISASITTKFSADLRRARRTSPRASGSCSRSHGRLSQIRRS